MHLPTQHFLWGYKKAHGAKPHVLFTPPSPNQPTEVWQPVASMPSWTQEPAARQQLQVPGPSLLGASHSHAPQGLPAFPDVTRGRQQGPPRPNPWDPETCPSGVITLLSKATASLLPMAYPFKTPGLPEPKSKRESRTQVQEGIRSHCPRPLTSTLHHQTGSADRWASGRPFMMKQHRKLF